MSAWAVVLVLFAAAFHAAWNTLLKSSDEPLATASRAALTSTLLWTPVAIVAWFLLGMPGFPPLAWLLAGVSALLELVYFVFLSRAYERGELSTVYTLARGTAPLLAVILGLTVLAERPGLVEFGGICCVLASLILATRPTTSQAAAVPALLTGLTIALYSAVDSVGVHQAPPWLYGFVVWAFTAALLTVLRAARGRITVREAPVGSRPNRGRGGDRRSLGTDLLIGVFMTGTYLLILIAFRLAPLIVVAPLRESSIIIVALWSVYRLGERSRMAARLMGAVGVAIGATLIAVH